MYTDFFTLTFANYFRLNDFLYKIPPTKDVTDFYGLTSLRITVAADPLPLINWLSVDLVTQRVEYDRQIY